MKDTIITLTPPIDGVQYGVSTDDIKEGDWYYNGKYLEKAIAELYPENNSINKKVILSTNPKDLRFPYLVMPSKEQEVEKLADDWYCKEYDFEDVRNTTDGKNILAKFRKPFIAGFNANKGIYTQEQMDKFPYWLGSNGYRYNSEWQDYQKWTEEGKHYTSVEIVREFLKSLQPTVKAVRVEMAEIDLGDGDDGFPNTKWQIKVETSSEYPQGVIKAIEVIY